MPLAPRYPVHPPGPCRVHGLRIGEVTKLTPYRYFVVAAFRFVAHATRSDEGGGLLPATAHCLPTTRTCATRVAGAPKYMGGPRAAGGGFWPVRRCGSCVAVISYSHKEACFVVFVTSPPVVEDRGRLQVKNVGCLPYGSACKTLFDKYIGLAKVAKTALQNFLFLCKTLQNPSVSFQNFAKLFKTFQNFCKVFRDPARVSQESSKIREIFSEKLDMSKPWQGGMVIPAFWGDHVKTHDYP